MNDWFEAEQRIERAQQLSESQRWAEALAEIEAALAINPHNAMWHAHRGCLLEELERWEEAVQAFESSLELEPGDADVSLALGTALTRLGLFSRAIQVFEELARLYPDLEPSYCHRIGVYAELGRHDQAEEMFYLAQELNDSCPHCFYHMGASLAAREQYGRAVYCWERVLELEPDYVGVNRRIAQAYRAQGQLDVAKEYYLREIREDPGDTDLLYEVAEMIVESGQVGQAAAKFAQIVELEPEHADAHFALGKISLSREQPEAAMGFFETVIRLCEGDPDLPGFEAKFGETLLRLGRLTEARAQLEAATERDADDREAVMLLGDCLVAMGKTSDAADAYRRVLSKDARDPFARHKLGVCLFRQGRPAAALEHCLCALEAKPDYLPATYAAILAHLELAQWREARSLLRRAVRDNPENADLRRIEKQLGYYRLRYHWRPVFRWVGRVLRRFTSLG